MPMLPDNNAHKSKGSALITALFIMTLVAIAATAMSTRLQLDIYRTGLTMESDKLYLASQMVSFWAMSELSAKDNHFYKSDKTGKFLDLPVAAQTLVPGVSIKGSLFDLQNRFNLNNIADKNYHPLFLKLLEKAADLGEKDRKMLLLAMIQWITPFTPGRGQDEFVTYYLQQKPPYNPSAQPMQHVSEFRLLLNVNAKIYNALSNFIIALPEATPINVNSASKKILQSLRNGLNKSEVAEILQARGQKGFLNKDELAILAKKLSLPTDQITLESQYFLSIAEVRSRTLALYNYTILKRTIKKNGTAQVSLISESLNSF